MGDQSVSFIYLLFAQNDKILSCCQASTDRLSHCDTESWVCFYDKIQGAARVETRMGRKAGN